MTVPFVSKEISLEEKRERGCDVRFPGNPAYLVNLVSRLITGQPQNSIMEKNQNELATEYPRGMKDTYEWLLAHGYSMEKAADFINQLPHSEDSRN